MAKARKGAEEKAARLEEGHKECDQLILQTDTLALRLFPDSQRYAVKKVDAQRRDKGQADLTVPWTPKDHLVALNARVSHMRCIDRNLSDIPDVATQLYRTLWPGEKVPATIFVPMLHFCLDQVHPCPCLLLWSIPAPPLYLTIHLPALALDHF
nr:uncharacterized protein LOC127326827 [Lolium perenne]